MIRPVPRNPLFGPQLPASLGEGGLYNGIASQLAINNTAYVTGFPTDDPEAFLTLLRKLGKPLEAQESDGLPPDRTLPPSINAVNCTPLTEGSPHLPDRGADLPLHSGRVHSALRPRYIAQLMVNAGWRDDQPGNLGESKAVRWTDVLASMKATSPETYARDFSLLVGTELTITAPTPADTVSTLPLVYPSERSSSGVDLGARLSLTMEEQFATAGVPTERAARYREALSRFELVANHPSVYHTYDMAVGDLVILDNNLLGHGRCSYTKVRTTSHGTSEENPREVWITMLM